MFDAYALEEIKRQFPALSRRYNGKRAIYFDGPGGTQTVRSALDAMMAYMAGGMANVHGQFPTSRETENVIAGSREAMADMLGCEAQEIAYGANATSQIFAVSRALSRQWRPGDEIVVSEMDHRANVDPWILAAQDRGCHVRWLPVDTGAMTLDYACLEEVINEKTRLVAVGYASNAVGTINDVRRIADRAHAVGAVVAVDAVHIAPHAGIDMRDIGADILFCSVYKFFGGHIGVAAVRAHVFEGLQTYRLDPAPSAMPGKLETGTQSHEAMASIVPALSFIESLGSGTSRRQRILSGLDAVEAHETALAGMLREELSRIPSVHLHQAGPSVRKTATIAFTVDGMHPTEFCRRICEDSSVFIADGNFYASTLSQRTGVEASGGWVRAGFAPYNDQKEVELFVRSVRNVLS